MIRASVIAGLTLLLASCVVRPTTDLPEVTEPTESASAVRTMDVRYGDEHYGYFALPEGPGPHPGIVVIHEWWGLNDNIKWYAEQLAQAGYAALAVDLYGGVATMEAGEARQLSSGVREDMNAAFSNLNQAVDFLHDQPIVDPDRLASLGWCFGGGWSYEMAKNNLGVKASVIYYGQFNPEDDLSIMSTNIMGHFGENDQAIPVDDVKAFRATLETLNGDHEIFIYENEGHGFARELKTDSAKKAWDRTMTFLQEQL